MGFLEVAADVLPRSVGPYVALMVAGFVVAIWGHGMRSKWTITIGLAMIFAATLLLPLALQIFSGDEGPDPERDFQTPAPLQPR